MNNSNNYSLESAVTYITEIFSEATGIPPSMLDPKNRFEEFGVDSFMIQKLNNKLKEKFGKLSNTLFFEFSDIESLTSHLLEIKGDCFPQESVPSAIITPAITESSENAGGKPSYRTFSTDNSRMSSKSGHSSKYRLAIKNKRASCPTSPRRIDSNNDIAIIGYSGSYPQSHNTDELWNKLTQGHDFIEEIPNNRWDHSAIYNSGDYTAGKTYAKWGSFIDDIRSFDSDFFKIAPRECELMDPQERKFLEETWYLLDSAGYPPSYLKQHYDSVGVFAGAFFGHYELWGRDGYLSGIKDVPSSSISLIANRTSYFFDFEGPSITIDTMCSSSLTAIHMACQSLNSGESDIAIAGGVNLIVHPQKYLYLSQSRFLSKDGRCRSFGAGGSGYVPGEGVGVLLLKPLKKAIQDGDAIHGTILASAINHGGKSNGFTVPSVSAQAKLITRSLQNAGIEPPDIDYIEAHGTGTELGDPIEIDALRKVFSNSKELNSVPIGSLKSNIGHLESAAGVAAVTKVLLQMKHGYLVPSIHSEPENPLLQLEESPVVVQKGYQKWQKANRADDGHRIATISSFGAGGSNASVVLKSYRNKQSYNHDKLFCPVLLFSAHSIENLKQTLIKRSDFILDTINKTDEEDRISFINNLCYTLMERKTHMDERYYIYFSDINDLINKLGSIPELATTLRAGNSSASLNSWFDIPEGDDFIRSLIANGRWGAIAKYWQGGVNIQWNSFINFENCYPLVLPKYVFKSIDYWYPNDISAHNVSKSIPSVLSSEKNIVNAVEAPGEPKIAYYSLSKRPTPVDAYTSIVSLKTLTLTGPSTATRIPSCIDHSNTYNISYANDSVTICNSSSGAEHTVDDFCKLIVSGEFDAIVDIIDNFYEYDSVLSYSVFLTKLAESLRFSDIQIVKILDSNATGYAEAIAHMLRCLPFEYKNISTKILKCDLYSIDINQVLGKIPTSNGSYTYINDGWYVDDLVTASPSTISTHNKVSADSAYIVAGGTRGIGLESAKELVRLGAQQLIITGIRPLPLQDVWLDIVMNPEHPDYSTIFPLNQLKQEVESLTVYSGRLDNNNLSTVIAKLLDGRKLGGVIYSAGTIDSDNFSFISKSRNTIDYVLNPKLASLVNFANAIELHNPEFFLVYSSIGGTFPRLSTGIIDYSAANHFANIFVQKKNNTAGTTKYYGIAWPNWKDIGMGSVITDNIMEPLGIHTITTSEGLSILHKVLTLKPALYVPMKVDNRFSADYMLGIVDKEIDKGVSSGISTLTTKVNADTSVVLESSSIGDICKGVISKTLKMPIEKISERANFSDLGVESVLMMELKSNFEKEFSIELDSSVLIEYSNIGRLINYIASLPITIKSENMPSTATPVVTQHVREHISPINIVSGTIDTPAPKLEKSVKASHAPKNKRIAVVGMAAVFPDAKNIQEFWSNVTTGKCSTKVPSKKNWADNILNESGTPVYIGEIEMPKTSLLEIAGNSEGEDLQQPDPNATLFLGQVIKAISDSGYESDDIRGKKVGVYVGARSDHNANNIKNFHKKIIPMVGQNFVAAHVSHYFDLKGPSMVIDTACSSGLVATHLSCQSLMNGDIDMAICGAVNLLLDDRAQKLLTAEGVISPTGKCSAFDQNANGFVLGEGAGALILKRLDDAISDSDRIYSVIESTGVNNNGRGLGINTPDIDANVNLITEVLEKLDIENLDIRYIEANGTGVQVSDMVELKSLEQAYGKASRTRKISVGSLKPNIGHLLNAAGIASLIKCILAANQREFAPMINIDTILKHFDFNNSSVQIANTLLKENENEQFYAAVNSLGDGGTNGHIIISNLNAPKVDLPITISNSQDIHSEANITDGLYDELPDSYENEEDSIWFA